MNLRFENDVKTYSIQTDYFLPYDKDMFENDVKTYSIQTTSPHVIFTKRFENDVKTYSIQTVSICRHGIRCLRMM